MVAIVMKKDDKIKPKFQFLVSQLQETRKRLMELLEKVPDDIIDKSPDDEKIETIATLLDHIAAVEWSWIFEDIDGKSMDIEEWKYAFALRDWSEVKQRKGKTKQYYIDRLNKVREEVMERLGKMTDDDRFRMVGQEEDRYNIEWILYHLNHHEAVHHGQISMLNRIFSTGN